MRAAKYDVATGEVLGIRTLTGDQPASMPALPQGQAYLGLAPDQACDPQLHRVVNGALVERQAFALAPIVLLVGESMTVPVPAGANWALDGAYSIGPKAVSFTEPGTHAIALHGAWRGGTTIAVMTAADYQASLIDQVKTEAERRRMLVMSTGGSKKTVYAAKAAEVENWNSLGAVGATVQALLLVFNGLNSTVRTRKFRFAIKDAASHGDTVDKAIARFTAGADVSLTEVARVEGIEQAAVDRIKAATTRQAKLAAFSAINWAAA